MSERNIGMENINCPCKKIKCERPMCIPHVGLFPFEEIIACERSVDWIFHMIEIYLNSGGETKWTYVKMGKCCMS